MTAPLTIERAAELRARAATLVAEARQAALESRDGSGSAERHGVRVSVLRGSWRVVGADRQVRAVRDQVEAIQVVLALLTVAAATTYDEVEADLERQDEDALEMERQSELDLSEVLSPADLVVRGWLDAVRAAGGGAR